LNAFETLGLSASATENEVRAAHRQLARRWHPDRFLPGPEREWAHEKMAEINTAYLECLSSCRPSGGDEGILAAARRLIECRDWLSARRTLMQAVLRAAEWNYLFGLVMRGIGEREKARMYLSVAVRQAPENAAYRDALRSVTPVPAVKKLARSGKRGFLTAARLFVNNIRL